MVDNSNSGWIPARGTHINEVTYGELDWLAAEGVEPAPVGGSGQRGRGARNRGCGGLRWELSKTR